MSFLTRLDLNIIQYFLIIKKVENSYFEDYEEMILLQFAKER